MNKISKYFCMAGLERQFIDPMTERILAFLPTDMEITEERKLAIREAVIEALTDMDVDGIVDDAICNMPHLHDDCYSEDSISDCVREAMREVEKEIERESGKCVDLDNVEEMVNDLAALKCPDCREGAVRAEVVDGLICGRCRRVYKLVEVSGIGV